MAASKKLCILVSFSGDGGVELVIARLVEQFIKQPGLDVDLLLIKARGKHLDKLPEAARIIKLKANSSSMATAEVVAYLRAEKPDVILAAKDRAGRLALRARKRSEIDAPVYLQIHSTLSASMKNKPALARWWRYRQARHTYIDAQRIFTVSDGVAADLQQITGLPASQFATVRNPLIMPGLLELAEGPAQHPWLVEGHEHPVILSAGRFTRQKDFATLIRAFARLRERQKARLIILGEGPLQQEIQALIDELKCADAIALPGWQDNPYLWMRQADLFVLSSAWEGLGNVLVEALAVGTPVVSTDCPSGPSEILQGGKIGPLVPVGDVPALALAMQSALRSPPDANLFFDAITAYHVEASAGRYLSSMGLASEPD
ncbi:MAG: glycosyltransferase [Thiotrichales bacterium]